MRSGSNPKVIAELQRIAKGHGGVLSPEVVVESARSESSVLHKMFCWDDDEAARQYRIHQARQVIRTTIRFVEINGDRRAVRVFVSLTPDREEDGGGYRDVIAVMQDKDMRRQMLEDALSELSTFEKKYAHLKELNGVFVASKSTRDLLVESWAA